MTDQFKSGDIVHVPLTLNDARCLNNGKPFTLMPYQIIKHEPVPKPREPIMHEKLAATQYGRFPEPEWERDYQVILHKLCRAANYEPYPTNPAHFYAMNIRPEFLGRYTFDALLLLDKIRGHTVYEEPAPSPAPEPESEVEKFLSENPGFMGDKTKALIAAIKADLLRELGK